MIQTVYIQTPLGIAKIVGDINGVFEISAMDDGEVSTTIPKELQECVNHFKTISMVSELVSILK